MVEINKLIIIKNYIHTQYINICNVSVYTDMLTHRHTHIYKVRDKLKKKLFLREMMLRLSLEEGALTWFSRRE